MRFLSAFSVAYVPRALRGIKTMQKHFAVIYDGEHKYLTATQLAIDLIDIRDVEGEQYDEKHDLANKLRAYKPEDAEITVAAFKREQDVLMSEYVALMKKSLRTDNEQITRLDMGDVDAEMQRIHTQMSLQPWYADSVAEIRQFRLKLDIGELWLHFEQSERAHWKARDCAIGNRDCRTEKRKGSPRNRLFRQEKRKQCRS